MCVAAAPAPGFKRGRQRAGGGPSCNMLGRRRSASGIATTCEAVRLARQQRLGVDVNVIAPLGASPADLARLGEADFNVVLYPEIGGCKRRSGSSRRPSTSRSSRPFRSALARRANSSPRSPLSGVDACAGGAEPANLDPAAAGIRARSIRPT
jgi:hypothetical protein